MAGLCGRLWSVGAVVALTGCGGATVDQFAPACPRPSILRDANDLQRFRGNGRDLLDTALQGRVVSINGECSQDGRSTVATTVRVGLELTRGPAAGSRSTEVQFFVAVSQGDNVLDKQVYTIPVTFPENTDRLQLTSEDIKLRIPVSKTTRADSYQITTGFQLTPAELEANRRRIGSRG